MTKMKRRCCTTLRPFLLAAFITSILSLSLSSSFVAAETASRSISGVDGVDVDGSSGPASARARSIPKSATLTADADSSSGDNADCEQLTFGLKYTQDTAPNDISAVLRVVLEKMNRELSGVMDVTIEWAGDGILHRRVGNHTVVTSVTRQQQQKQQQDEKNQQIIKQYCFRIPIEITDTNECELLPQDSKSGMSHLCHESSVCVNTIGGYECSCPKIAHVNDGVTDDSLVSPWELSIFSSTCPSSLSTLNCCSLNSHDMEGRNCRERFICPMDPCRQSGAISSSSSAVTNECVNPNSCERASTPQSHPNYSCSCPKGTLGTGLKCASSSSSPLPRVLTDGITPTNETVANPSCGCNIPTIDACEEQSVNFCSLSRETCLTNPKTFEPYCQCQSGYVYASNNVKKYGCVNESPPKLRLTCNDDTATTFTNANSYNTIYKQGDIYQECEIDVLVENPEEYTHTLKIHYSQPLPRTLTGCLPTLGTFHVNYTVETPWTTPPFVGVVREVSVQDVNECDVGFVRRYGEQCPELVPHCDVRGDAAAACVNTLGSYECQCPEYTTGDGFMPLRKEGITNDYNTDGVLLMTHPPSYMGGTGCVDTHKPHIKVLGSDPKILRVGKSDGWLSYNSDISDDNDRQKIVNLSWQARRDFYETQIKEIVHTRQHHDELVCSPFSTSSFKINAEATTTAECVQATDQTHRGIVNLSSRLEIGEPIRMKKQSTSSDDSNMFMWKLPYNVQDDAGNRAETEYRTIIVKEMSLFDMEYEWEMNQDTLIAEAVKSALELERSSSSRGTGGGERRNHSTDKNSSCPKCDCIHNNSADRGTINCEKECNHREQPLKLKLEQLLKQQAETSQQTCTYTADVKIAPQQQNQQQQQNTLFIQEIILNTYHSTIVPMFIVFLCASLVYFLCSCFSLFGANNRYPKDGFMEEHHNGQQDEDVAVTYYRSPLTSGNRSGNNVNNHSSPFQKPLPNGRRSTPFKTQYDDNNNDNSNNTNRMHSNRNNGNNPNGGGGLFFSPDSQTSNYAAHAATPGSSSNSYNINHQNHQRTNNETPNLRNMNEASPFMSPITPSRSYAGGSSGAH